MSKELIVSAGRHETRVAILDDDQVVELFHEREKEYSLAGSIHKGRVTRVLPGMQSAFVDIGLDRDAFLYVSDFFEDNEEYDAVVSVVEDKVLKMDRGGAAEPAVAATAPAPGEAASAVTDRAAPVEAASAAAPPSESRQERQEGARDDSRRERGGRGRRGRRRRGGRGSGLPDSKFFSPRAEARVTDTEPAGAVEAAAPAQSADDFMVLPGESLAKYTADEESEEQAEDAQRASQTIEVESALPDEHPLAGFGEVTSWVATPAAAAPAPASESSASAESAAAVREAPAAIEEESTAVEEAPASAVTPRNPVDDVEDEGLSAGELAEAELVADVRASEVLEDTEAPAEDAAEGVVDEGPEPARIPTSLTAHLREQGHRYPHRVSRRMRRKMRGDQPRGGEAREDGERSPAADRGEDRTVAPRREERGRDERSREERGAREEHRGRERAERERPALPSISDLLKEGQEIIVQIAKEPLGQKGARITSHIALPGRFVVYMPTVEHVGVSRKIPSDEERQRLKRVLQTHRQGIPGGFICRTAAENKSEEELRSDMHFLYNLWLDMRQKAEKRPAPVLLHHDLDLVQRILRDQLTTSFKTIWVDNEELYAGILSFVERFQPALIGRVKLYTRTNPIFDEFGITAEIEKALRPKVWLKSGGYIVINQTEALVAIDINTGKYVGKSNRLEDTIVKVNTDAIREIVRQIRLRDLGGIIVVDFIDMDERKNRQKVMMALEDGMRADRAPYKILQFNDFGLVAITRKRVKQSLERTLCTPCTYCEGAGYIKSVATVISEILQEAQKLRKSLENEQSNLVLRVNPEVARVLKSNHNSYLQEIEEVLGKQVMIKSDPLLHQTKFDLA